MWPVGRNLANFPYILPFSVLSFHCRLFLSLFELLSILLFPPELPLCSWQREACAFDGKRGLSAAFNAHACSVSSLTQGAIRGMWRASSHHQSLPPHGSSPTTSQGLPGPHVTSSRSTYLGVGRAGKRKSPADHDLDSQRGQKIVFLYRHPDFCRFK